MKGIHIDYGKRISYLATLLYTAGIYTNFL